METSNLHYRKAPSFSSLRPVTPGTRDIVGATTSIDQDYASIQGQRYLYRIERFSMRIVNGDFIDVGAYIRATAIESNRQGPTFIPPTMNIDQALAKLRQLLRFKRQWSI